VLEEPVGPVVAQLPAACVIVAFWRLAAFCDRTLPTREEPVLKSTFSKAKRMPCIEAPAPIAAVVPTRQKMFFACAQPERNTCVFAACVRVLDICMIKTSSGPPSKVMSEVMVTPDVNVYTPGKKVWPPTVPPPIFVLEASV
jgi:hypothetical protein